ISFPLLSLSLIGRMDDSWTVFFFELLYVFIPILALYPASSLPHRLNRLSHYFNPIDNPINAIPPTVPVTASNSVKTPIQESTMVSALAEATAQRSEMSLRNLIELRSEREAAVIGDD
ncbi:hypothetical protein PFISCL1PPCAC_23960, partial [Pristionchus fissidentatus]